MSPNIRIFNHIRQNDKSDCVFHSLLRIIHNKTVLFTPLKRNSTVFIWILCTRQVLQPPTIPSARIHSLPGVCSHSSSGLSSTDKA